jgi:uncharacterized membrane protein
MKSKVTIAGHPIHPMLVGFPVTMYVTATVCFIANAMGASPFWFRVGVYANLAGVIAAAVAAIPGFIDWALVIPSGTPAKATGLAHMGFNVASLLVFTLNVILQWPHRADVVPPVGLSIALTVLGTVLTMAAGFLGWKLVQTHHVGVELTPEQERYEPRPQVDRGGKTTTTTGHGATR